MKGTGETVKKSLTVAPIHGIEITGSLDVELTQAPAQSVEVEGQANVAELVQTTVTDGIWKINTSKCYSTDKPFTILNPGRLTNDISVSRSFKIASTSLQFRWEIFNVINHVNLDAPIVALNNANFGRVLTAGDPRIMQLALKYTF